LVLRPTKWYKWLNFEFMDSKYLPISLRLTLRDILEAGNSKPFRQYYDWSSKIIFEFAQNNNITQIVELGAGSAPISTCLAKKYKNWDINFVITDLEPDILKFQELKKIDSRIQPEFTSIDFSKRIKSFRNALFVLSGTFHHIPSNLRIRFIENIIAEGQTAMVFEPLRFNYLSFLLVFFGPFVGFFTPLLNIRSKTFYRNFFWCWLIPIAPFLFCWDGIVSVARIWSNEKWQKLGRQKLIQETLFCCCVTVKK
jgi:hypothetical protein